MRRIIALISALTCTALLFSCGFDKGDSSSEESSEEVSEETTEDETEEETTVSEEESTISVSFDEPPLLKAALHGKLEDTSYIQESRNVIHREYAGIFGVPVEIGGFDDGILLFEYDPENMENVPPQNLVMLWYDEENCSYNEVKDFRLNTEKNTVTAKVEKPGTYLLADSLMIAHDTVYKNDEFGFRIEIPEEITLRYIAGSPLEDDEEGKFKVLLECEKNDYIQIGIEYLQRPGYSSAAEMVEAICQILDPQDSLRESGTINGMNGDIANYFFADFSEEDDPAYSINCFYSLNDNEYINIWYGFKDMEYYDKAIQSLESFAFTGEYQPEDDTTETEKPECPFSPEDVVFNLPSGMKAVPASCEPFQATDDPDHYIAQLYTIDSSGYSGSAVIYIEAERDGLFPATEADAYCDSIVGVRGVELIRRDETDLSNGKKGYILQAEFEGADQNNASGSCYINGFFDTVQTSWSVRVTVVADRALDQSKKDELYEFVKNIDIKK